VAGARVLITGVANPFGTALALALAARPDVERVVGLDTRPLSGAVADRVELLQADLRSPELGAAVRRTAADVVVHNDILQFPEPGRSARHLHDVNVVGTLYLGIHAARAMVSAGGGGAIVNVSSGSQCGQTLYGPYSASNGGVAAAITGVVLVSLQT